MGDRVTYGTTGVVYISGRTSQTVWNVITATGTQPIATTSAVVNSIGHEFNSLNSAMGGAVFNSSHINTKDITIGNFILNVPVYYDNGPDTTAVYMSDATTTASNYVRIYTATSTTEVNRSQRHTGKWTDNAYRIETSNSTSIQSANINYLRIEGLQIKIISTIPKSGIQINGKTYLDTADFQISNNIIQGVVSGSATDNSGIVGYYSSISSSTMKITNNIIYGFKNGTAALAGIRVFRMNLYAYNNTLVNNYRGIYREVASNNIVVKNNIVQDSAIGYSGTFTTSSTKNISNTSHVASSTSDYSSTTVAFADPANGDFHIVGGDTAAKDMGADLSGDSAFPFNTDIDGQTRPNGSAWDIGADESYASSDVTLPIVTAFTMPSTSNTLAVSVNSFTANDDIGVAMYIITESSTTPSLNNANWSTSTPNTFTFTGGGVKTAYAWVRDTSGNISTSSSQTVDFLRTTYYIDATSGNDANTGTSTSQAWQTIAKVNSRTLLPGDQVLFKRGETWREQLTIPSSGVVNYPITFDTYGTGATSTISGSNLVTDWTNYSGNIYVADVGTISQPTQLYVDGVFHDIASTYVGGATSGYMLATANSVDTTSIIDSDLTLTSSDIVGSTVITKAVPWALSTNTAIAYDAGTHKITLNGNVYSTQVMRTGYGFYLQNKLWMLDAPGEWFYATTTGKLYLWTTDSDNPTTRIVEVSNRSYGINTSGKNYVTIQNLNIKNANLYDVAATSSNNINLGNLNISGSQIGIYATALSTSTVLNNSIQNSLLNGILITSSSTNINILNNTVNNAGNMGSNPKYSSGSIGFNGSYSNIDNNIITNNGNSGINYKGDQTVVSNNRIDRSCLVLTDCAGIYTNNTGYDVGWTSIIRNNTVTNSIGNLSGTSYDIPSNLSTQAQGIYLDDLSHGYTVTNNIVYNANIGFFINTGYNNILTNNYAYYSRISGLNMSEDSSSFGGMAGSVHDNVITNNIFETMSNSDATYLWGVGSALLHSQFTNTSNFGTFNNNQYCHPNSSIAVSNTNVSPTVNYTLPAWQAYSGQDANSTDTTAYCSRPALTTSSASSIRAGTATLNGNTTNKGYDLSTLRGFEYSTSPSMDTIIATTTDSGTFDTGIFTKNLTDLTPDTTYYYRAYSTNTAGTTLGNIESFRTQSAPRSSGGSTAQSRVNNLLAMGNTTLANQIAQQYNIAITPAVNTTKSANTFTRYLQLGMSGNDIKQLQIFLNSKGYIISATGPGSKGNETTMFGSLTKKALMKFQKDNKISATGYFGPLTKQFIFDVLYRNSVKK